MDSINIMADAMMRMASRYPNDPSTRCLSGKKFPEAMAPHMAENIKDTDIGILMAAKNIKLRSITKKYKDSGINHTP
jgi:hypothetical protein